MALRTNIKLLSALLVTIILSTSCNKDSAKYSDVDCDTYDYSDCQSIEPVETDLKLLFTINKNYSWVPFEIYKGSVDKGELVLRDTAWNSTITYVMPIPEKYSVKAIYELNGQTIYTIDGAKLEATSVPVCDSNCWSVAVSEFDLRLH